MSFTCWFEAILVPQVFRSLDGLEVVSVEPPKVKVFLGVDFPLRPLYKRRLSSWKGPFCTSILVGGRVAFLG